LPQYSTGPYILLNYICAYHNILNESNNFCS